MNVLAMGIVALVLAYGAGAEQETSWLPEGFRTINVAAPFDSHRSSKELPIVVAPFYEHVRGAVENVSAENATGLAVDANGAVSVSTAPLPVFEDGQPLLASVRSGDTTWYGTAAGLYFRETNGAATRYTSYGVNGPLASCVTALAVDSKGTLWVGTPLGLSFRHADGSWSHLRGKDGLPIEDVTALALNERDEAWIGTSKGAILYCPEAKGRQWFYRAGKRYLPGDQVRAIALAPGGMPAYFLTDGGIGKIEAVKTTLLERARTIEQRINERHRRMGMVADCMADDAEHPTKYTLHDNDNDGLWTAYHVAAMALCYGTTQDPAARDSAREGMQALYLLQNVSGIPGVVARSVLPPELGMKKDEQWRPSPDGTLYWKSDTSSDEIDGHYLAFYTYYEHIAQHDAAECALLREQIRKLTDTILDNGYRLMDWDGKRTKWGFWDPKTLNEQAAGYVECGLNSLQMLSFLKVAQYVTGDEKYQEQYRKLILEHGYLSNVLLVKHTFPDTVNHSDDQLGYVAWYPILQLEKDKHVRRALLTGVQRHYLTVEPEHPSFYAFVTGTAVPRAVDFEAAVENLRQIPTDRRLWAVRNSVRADVAVSPYPDRFGRTVLTAVLPADERCFEKWNQNPYIPDQGSYGGEHDGRVEDDGAAFLLPYWMGRFHGFIAEAE